MMIINLLGLFLIALVIWWFWLYKPTQVSVEEKGMTIVVNNGVYKPSRIKIPRNTQITLEFLREDASPCAEILQIPALQISETLPLHKPRKIQLPPLESGTYEFHCQMQMYKGELLVE